jgi:hypothetical protein
VFCFYAILRPSTPFLCQVTLTMPTAVPAAVAAAKRQPSIPATRPFNGTLDISPYTERTISALGPISVLPQSLQTLKHWRILITVTAVNSFTQRVLTYFRGLGINTVQAHIWVNAETVIEEAARFQPDIILCPFLTAIIPEELYNRVSPPPFSSSPFPLTPPKATLTNSTSP